jgi:type VI secretion system secreted protein Hcp
MAVDVFLKIKGIPGESTNANHKGEIEILSFSWGVSQTGHAGGGGGGAGKVSMQDFHFVHRVDKASPLLLKAVCQGAHIPEAVVSVADKSESDRGGSTDFLVLKFENILISGIRPGANAVTDDEAMEAVSFNFSKMSSVYRTPEGETSATIKK